MNNDCVAFKYRSINKYLIESLVHSHIYFAEPSKLNDPFDCQINLRDVFCRALKLANGNKKNIFIEALKNKALFSQWTQKYRDVGVFSFSLNGDNALMWSHYADEHRGVRLRYRFSDDFLKKDEHKIQGKCPVSYDDNALVQWLINIPNEPPDELINNFPEEVAKIVLTSKSLAWKHEEELRLVRQSSGTLKISTDCLEEICFGLRTPPADIDMITKLAKQYTRCIKFSLANRNETDFGVTYNNFSPMS
nr:DUF2971 domain-containing protein [uncultured Undibacterium sp.]